MNIDFTLWPNPDGNLGNIKVTIPTGTGDDTWPDGDALINNVVYKDGKISGFVDTKALTVNDSKSSAINYDYVNIHLESIKEGDITFNRGERSKYFTVTYGSGNSGDTIILGTKYANCRTAAEIRNINSRYWVDDIVDGTWIESLKSLTTQYDTSTGQGGLFFNCDNLISFKSDLSSLTDGKAMFTGCINLKSFDIPLPKMTSSINMFSYDIQRNLVYPCTSLSSFNVDLPELTNATEMFCGCQSLSSFNSYLPKLITATDMFAYKTIRYDIFKTATFYECALTSFSTEVPLLATADRMFYRCSKLTSFSSAVPSLTSATDMFTGCRLNTASVKNIAETINTVEDSPTIGIGIGNTTPNDQETTSFNTIASKGWTVYVNGSAYTPASAASIMTLDETGVEVEIPIPFYAKPVEAIEDEAEYEDEQGNFYNIVGAQFIYGDDISTYGMFTCEEDAAINMGLTKIEREK